MKISVVDRARRIELVELLRRIAALPRIELLYLAPEGDPESEPKTDDTGRRPHQHDFYELLFFGAEDGCVIRTALPGVIHCAAAKAELEKRFFTVWLLRDRFFCVIEDKLALLSYYTPGGAAVAEALSKIIDAGAILARAGTAGRGFDEIGRAMLSLLEEVAQMLPHDAENPATIVERAVAAIHNNYSSGMLTAATVAATVGRSLQCLNAAFRRQLGTTVQQYIVAERIRAAAFSLRHTDSSIATIAKACGWNDVAYFSNIFRRRCGMTPGAFRVAENVRYPD